MHTHEHNILERIVDGDVKAFEMLFDTMYVSLVQYASFYILDVTEAEDIVQDLFVSIWEKRHSLKDVGNLKGYLLRWVKNNCLNYINRCEVINKYRQNHMINEICEVDTDPEVYYKAIYELIKKMPERRRIVFELSVFQAKSYAEIAEDLDISINTVKDHMKAAYAYLRKESAQIPYP